jgi:signal transduction histidine kinase
MQAATSTRAHIWNGLPLHVKGLMLLMVPVPALMLVAVVLSGTIQQERLAAASADQVTAALQRLQDISALLLVPGTPAQDYEVLSKITRDLGPVTADPDQLREIDAAIQQKLTSLAARSVTLSPDESLVITDQLATRRLQADINVLALGYDRALSTELGRVESIRAKLFTQCFKGAFIFLLGELLAALVFLGAITGQIHALKSNSRLLAEGRPLMPLFTDNWELNQIGRDLVEASVALDQRGREIESTRGRSADSERPEHRYDDEQRESMLAQLRERNQELSAALSKSRETASGKGRFLSDLSRELRIPLASILGFSELLYDGKLGTVTEQQKGCLSDILAGSKRLLQLADSVVGAARSEAAPAPVISEAVDLRRLLNEVQYSLVPAARKKGVRIEIDVDSTLCKVSADCRGLKELLHRYIANAIQFTPHDATLDVRVRPEGPTALRIEVQSTGLGMPSKDILRLFPEFHVESAASETAKQPATVEDCGVFYAILPGVARPAEPVVKARAVNPGATKGASALVH